MPRNPTGSAPDPGPDRRPSPPALLDITGRFRFHIPFPKKLPRKFFKVVILAAPVTLAIGLAVPRLAHLEDGTAKSSPRCSRTHASA